MSPVVTSRPVEIGRPNSLTAPLGSVLQRSSIPSRGHSSQNPPFSPEITSLTARLAASGSVMPIPHLTERSVRTQAPSPPLSSMPQVVVPSAVQALHPPSHGTSAAPKAGEALKSGSGGVREAASAPFRPTCGVPTTSGSTAIAANAASNGAGHRSGSCASRHMAAEQRRRARINERLEALREIVPHSARANTAAFLTEVYDYISSLHKELNRRSDSSCKGASPDPEDCVQDAGDGSMPKSPSGKESPRVTCTKSGNIKASLVKEEGKMDCSSGGSMGLDLSLNVGTGESRPSSVASSPRKPGELADAEKVSPRSLQGGSSWAQNRGAFTAYVGRQGQAKGPGSPKEEGSVLLGSLPQAGSQECWKQESLAGKKSAIIGDFVALETPSQKKLEPLEGDFAGRSVGDEEVGKPCVPEDPSGCPPAVLTSANVTEVVPVCVPHSSPPVKPSSSHTSVSSGPRLGFLSASTVPAKGVTGAASVARKRKESHSSSRGQQAHEQLLVDGPAPPAPFSTSHGVSSTASQASVSAGVAAGAAPFSGTSPQGPFSMVMPMLPPMHPAAMAAVAAAAADAAAVAAVQQWNMAAAVAQAQAQAAVQAHAQAQALASAATSAAAAATATAPVSVPMVLPVPPPGSIRSTSPGAQLLPGCPGLPVPPVAHAGLPGISSLGRPSVASAPAPATGSASKRRRKGAQESRDAATPCSQSQKVVRPIAVRPRP